jgi:hypothetical protein
MKGLSPGTFKASFNFLRKDRHLSIELGVSRSLQESVDWILEKQSRKSGCFEAVGQLIHSSLAGPEQSLTASVLVRSGTDVTIFKIFSP